MAKAAIARAAKANPIEVADSGRHHRLRRETGELLHDFTTPGDRFIVAKGGRGGRGNARFATSTHQAPTEHEDGVPAKNATASAIEAAGRCRAGRVSQCRQIHADLTHFGRETQDRRLSLHYAGAESGRGQRGEDTHFVVADIPGLIEGAHLGHGLGVQFLRHIERTRLLVHLVDVSEATGRDPVHDFEIVMEELRSFSDDLADKPMIVVATKIDAAQDPERIASLRKLARERRLPFLKISSVTGEGLPALKRAHGGRRVDHARRKAAGLGTTGGDAGFGTRLPPQDVTPD